LSGRPWKDFDVSPDGSRFLTIVPKIVANELPVDVVVNWTSETPKSLKRRGGRGFTIYVALMILLAI